MAGSADAQCATVAGDAMRLLDSKDIVDQDAVRAMLSWICAQRGQAWERASMLREDRDGGAYDKAPGVPAAPVVPLVVWVPWEDQTPDERQLVRSAKGPSGWRKELRKRAARYEALPVVDGEPQFQ